MNYLIVAKLSKLRGKEGVEIAQALKNLIPPPSANEMAKVLVDPKICKDEGLSEQTLVIILEQVGYLAQEVNDAITVIRQEKRKETYDGIHIRDTIHDIGKVPSGSGNMYTSPDIISLSHEVGTTPLDFLKEDNWDQAAEDTLIEGQINYIYVRAKNLTSGSVKGRIYLHYCPASVKMDPSQWKDNQLITYTGHGYVAVSANQAGEKMVGMEPFLWNPEHLPSGHYCLIAIARVTSLEGSTDDKPLSHIPSHEYLDSLKSFSTYVTRNPNIAWQNVSTTHSNASHFETPVLYKQGSLAETVKISIIAKNVPIGSKVWFRSETSGPEPLIELEATVDSSNFIRSLTTHTPANYESMIIYGCDFNGKQAKGEVTLKLFEVVGEGKEHEIAISPHHLDDPIHPDTVVNPDHILNSIGDYKVAMVGSHTTKVSEVSEVIEWKNMGDGIKAEVLTIAINSQGNLYAGCASKDFIAKWDGHTWSNFGTNISNDSAGYSQTVHAIAIDSKNNLYVGGRFTTIGGVNAKNIAKWDGTVWSALGKEIDCSSITALAIDSHDNLYVGGFLFSKAGEVKINNIAKWDGLKWSALGDEVEYDNNFNVEALAIDSQDNLYVGGQFHIAGRITAHNIVKWDGSNWSTLGDGTDSGIHALAIDSHDNLYAGGDFSKAGGITAKYIAKWDGSRWSNLGRGPEGINSNLIRAMAVDSQDNLYIGGQNEDSQKNTHVAKWNGRAWSFLGSGMSGPIFTLAIDNQNNFLYVGGAFEIAGEININNIAQLLLV